MPLKTTAGIGRQIGPDIKWLDAAHSHFYSQSVAKVKTLSEAETARRRAVTGLRNLGRDEDADRIESLSPREYADEKGFEIIENPRRRRIMPRRVKSREELEAELEDLQAENAELQETVEELQGQIDDIGEIIGVEEEEEEEDEGDDESEE